LKTDLRVLRTQKSINESFLRLLEQKNYDKITVQDIANEAFINRNTFYMHYFNKEDLLEKLSRECLGDLEKSLVVRKVAELDEDFIFNLVKDVLETIEKNKKFYRIMMVDSNSSFFSEQLKKTIEKYIYEYNSKKDSAEIKILIEYLITGFIGIICRYLKGDLKISIEELSSLLFRLLYENPYAFLVQNE